VVLLESRVGLALGLLTHPLELCDRLSVRLAAVRDEAVHVPLVARRVVPRDVHLAHGLAERSLDERHPALPPFAQLLRARERAAVEVEVRLDELSAQVRRASTDDVEGEPVAPRIDRLVLPRGRALDREVRLAHDELVEGPGRDTERLGP